MSSALEALRETIRSRVFVDGAHARAIDPSGRRAPWMFDFRAVAMEPDWLDRYADMFWERFADRLPFQVGGMETAAIPLVAAIVMKSKERGTPVSGFYVRKSRDRDGLLKRVEGTLTDAPVILVDDLINSGGSFQKQLAVLDDLGKRVTDFFAILAFRSPEAYAFARRRGIAMHHLLTLEDFGLPLQTTLSAEVPRELFRTEWKFAAEGPSFEWVLPKSAPCFDETHAYFGTDAGVFYALDKGSGEVAWRFAIRAHPDGKGIFSSPALHDGMIYFGGYDGVVYALDGMTGRVQWTFDRADWVGSSPALAPDLGLLFVGLEYGLFRKRGGIAALDLRTGKLRWEDRTPSFTHGSPLYIREEGLVVIGSNDGVAYAYAAGNGARKWTYQTGGDIKARPAYDARHRLILIPSMDIKLYAFSPEGEPRWAHPAGAGLYSDPLVAGDRVFAASLDKSLYALDLESGKERGRFTTGGRIFASPVLADGALWIGSNDGRLYELDPDTLRERGSHQFSERIVNAIRFDADARRFFVSTIANELYCLTRA